MHINRNVGNSGLADVAVVAGPIQEDLPKQGRPTTSRSVHGSFSSLTSITKEVVP